MVAPSVAPGQRAVALLDPAVQCQPAKLGLAELRAAALVDALVGTVATAGACIVPCTALTCCPVKGATPSIALAELLQQRVLEEGCILQLGSASFVAVAVEPQCGAVRVVRSTRVGLSAPSSTRQADMAFAGDEAALQASSLFFQTSGVTSSFMKVQLTGRRR